MTGSLVEPPGTAPGSEPIITGAFIAIVGVAPDNANIGRPVGWRKARDAQLFGCILRRAA